MFLDVAKGAVKNPGKDMIKGEKLTDAHTTHQPQHDAVLGQISGIIYTISQEGSEQRPNLLLVSPKIETLLSITKAELRRDPDIWPKLLHPEDRETVLRELAHLRKSSESYTLEYRFLSHDGRPVWFRDQAMKIGGQAGKPPLIQGVMLDITDFKKTEKKLQIHTRRLMALAAVGKAILAAQRPEETAQAVLNRIQQIVPCSRASVTLFDFEAREFIALAAHFKGPSEFRSGSHLPLDSLTRDLEILKQGKVVLVKDVHSLKEPSLHIRKLQKEGLRSYLYVPLMSINGLIGSLNLGEDHAGAFTENQIEIVRELADAMAVAIEQARLLERVRDQRERLRRLATRLAETQEEERQNLARELHDQVGQNLTALNLNLNVIRRLLPPQHPPELDDRLDESLRLLEETTEHVRGVMVELRPLMMDDYGLVAALHWCCEQFALRTGISCKVAGNDLKQRLIPRVEMALFRIVQEALNNITKHAQAGQVVVSVKEEDGCVRLAVSDNGNGFDLRAHMRSQVETGWGLVTMRERAAMVGARIRVETGPREGTQVIVEMER